MNQELLCLKNNFKIITKGIYSPDLIHKNFENHKMFLCVNI